MSDALLLKINGDYIIIIQFYWGTYFLHQLSGTASYQKCFRYNNHSHGQGHVLM